ncbi:MAG: glycosyltransferase [Chlamydiia bacterium]|nr:glycosyltransferase [Chlamydiia bacterium]
MKNESRVIERCLRSVKPLIDYWVIVDTGSSDGTQEIIREFMKDIPGELHEEVWVNFGHNRNQALDFARDRGDYFLFMDADEELIIAPSFTLPHLDKDYYFICSEYSGTRYKRIQLIKNSKEWIWRGAVHEVLVPGPGTSFETLDGVVNCVRFEGCVSQDPKAFLKDAQVFEEQLIRNPFDTRAAFYLAQSYRDAGEEEKAALAYQRRIALGGWDEEIFWSKYQLAHLEHRMGKGLEEVLENYYKAWIERPSRLEPLYYIVSLCRQSSQNDRAFTLSKLALERIEREGVPNERLFVESWIYDYGMLFEYSIAAYWVGKYKEAEQATLKLLNMPDLPPNFLDQAKKNLLFIQKKLAPLKDAA